MEPEVLARNLERTLATMYTQTGKKPGGATSECARVVRGAISGADVNFTEPSSDLRSVQEAEDIIAGMRYYSVAMTTGEPLSSAIPILLQQQEMPIDALLVRGTVKGTDENHIIAIVPVYSNSPPTISYY